MEKKIKQIFKSQQRWGLNWEPLCGRKVKISPTVATTPSVKFNTKLNHNNLVTAFYVIVEPLHLIMVYTQN